MEGTLAHRLRAGDVEARRGLLGRPLALRPDNFVARPWGGRRLPAWKALPEDAAPDGAIGESFEAAAFPADDEAGRHPSVVLLPDGSELPLPDLLACVGREVLGDAHLHAFGPTLPLLPKLLDVKELLSVQAHPPGNPELYVVLEAEPGATIRLGFAEAVERGALRALWTKGREAQARLRALLGPDVDARDVQRALAGGLADPTVSPAGLVLRLEGLRGRDVGAAAIEETLSTLADVVRRTLDLLTVVPVRAGDVIWNATPEGTPLAAEVHALGNEAGREILLLEVRRPGVTLRAWDHGRFPVRAVAIDAALGALRLEPRSPDSFRVSPAPRPDASGVERIVETRAFVVDRLRARPGDPVRIASPGVVQVLHGVKGRATLLDDRGGARGVLERGRTVLLPASLEAIAVFTDDEDGAEAVLAHVPVPETPPDGRRANLEDLRRVVDASRGPTEAIAIVNGGDRDTVAGAIRDLAGDLFRRDGGTRVFAHEESPRRGQLLGLLDALRARRAVLGPLDPDRVAVGIMLPGQGTRLSPLTQRLHGIKPFLPVLVRHAGGSGRWLNGATASLYTWTLVAHHLERMGFRGVAWKWGDEPQVPDTVLAGLRLDLSAVDAVRFGAEVVVTDDLARNKEWLFRDAAGRLVKQVRRRPLADLRRAFGIPADQAEVRALVHIGSPALSHGFLEEADRVFGDVRGVLDVDGWLFEALTHDEDAWAEEVARDAGLRALLAEHPDFHARVRALRARLEDRRGAPLAVQVIDFGAGLYWGDVGQLDKARRAFLAVAAAGADGDFARSLAAIDDGVPDPWGNRVLDSTGVPRDGSLRDSVVLGCRLGGDVRGDGVVLVDCEVARARLGRGSVVVGSTVLDLGTGREAFVFRAIGEQVHVPDRTVHTDIPADPTDVSAGLEAWRMDLDANPGSGAAWTEAWGENPASFAAKLAQVRRRDRPPEVVEQDVDRLWRGPLRERMPEG